jgi:hypothetical protein
MKKMAFLLLAVVAMLQISCNKEHVGGNLPLSFKTVLEQFHKWNMPYSLLDKFDQTDGLIESVNHTIDFDGRQLIFDKGTDAQIVYDVDDYTYNETDIYNGQGKQEQYIITATCKADGNPTHNISIIKAAANNQEMMFVTLPLIDKRNELSGVIVMYGTP